MNKLNFHSQDALYSMKLERDVIEITVSIGHLRAKVNARANRGQIITDVDDLRRSLHVVAGRPGVGQGSDDVVGSGDVVVAGER